jgi:hypothetical protein
MAAVIINTALNAGQKILRKQQRSTEVDGLVTLVETYTIRTADLATLEPDRNTTHTAYSTSSVKYSRMLVETTVINPLDGDLSELQVTYVGLDYASGLPPAYITTVGQAGAGVFGADASIVVRYLSDGSLFDTLKGGQITLNLGASQLSLPTKRFLPSSINGTAMPPNPRAKEYRRTLNFAETVAALPLPKPGTFFSGSVIQWPALREWIYAGYVQTGISFKRRGLFNQIEEQFTEYFRGSDDFFTNDGAVNLSAINGLSGKSFNF